MQTFKDVLLVSLKWQHHLSAVIVTRLEAAADDASASPGFTYEVHLNESNEVREALVKAQADCHAVLQGKVTHQS